MRVKESPGPGQSLGLGDNLGRRFAVFLRGFHLRLFLAVLMMVLLSQGVYLAILRWNSGATGDWRETLSGYLEREIIVPMTDKPLSEANVFLGYFNTLGPQLWFEDGEGRVAARALGNG
jgi:hypothetical protein